MLVVLAGAGVIGSVVLRGNAEAASGADAVRLEPTSFAGANPFVSPVGKDQPVSAVAAGGEFSGATAGLYARNPAIPACDGQNWSRRCRPTTSAPRRGRRPRTSGRPTSPRSWRA